MKRLSFYFLIFIAAAFFACAEKQIQEQKTAGNVQSSSEETDKLARFFRICHSDIMKAVNVVETHKMIGILTHLKKMDMDGKKYYLLEREHLTEMIKAVTEGSYSDIILINNKGVIIYTMENDDLFGKNVKHQLKDTAIERCFDNCTKDFYINDITYFPRQSGKPTLFVAYPDRTDDNIRGVLIIQINIEIIESLFNRKTSIIGKEGNYRLDKDPENILKPYKYFDKIDFADLNKKGKNELEIQNKKYTYYPFNNNFLSWVIISEN